MSQSPSFDALGIAAPHLARFGALGFSSSPKGLGLGLDGMIDHQLRSQTEFDLLTTYNTTHLTPNDGIGIKESRMVPSCALASSLVHDMATLTPPAEKVDIEWESIARIPHAPTDPRPVDTVIADGLPAEDSPATGVTPQSQHAEQNSSVDVGRTCIDPALNVLRKHLLGRRFHSWEILTIYAVDGLRHKNLPNNPLRVLSHALPSPSHTGHLYPTIINAIHNTTPASPTIWINVFHAIQGRFNLADLPTSPPSTPAPPNTPGSDDYFTQKVFDSAVPISDYQEDLSSLPRSPRPIVPPSSINISFVERYIPPTSSHEFMHMFDPNGPSVLVDRLVELSPDNGTLLFIYPTKVGAETFMRDYLGPILDPLLRSIVVVNGLSSDLSRTLGNMAAVNQLPDYEHLKRQMLTLCAKLSPRNTYVAGLHVSKATYSLVHAAKEEVFLSRDAWAKDWWAKQEKPRIREAMTKYANEAQKKSSNEHVERSPTPTELIQQLLEGVCKKSYPPGQEPANGIEVSVFVIKRSD